MRVLGFFSPIFAASAVAFGVIATASAHTSHPETRLTSVTNGTDDLAPLTSEKPADGRPTVRLDRLTFPRDVVGAPDFEKHLTRSLKKEASRADWGAGRENRIEYRFSVTELKYTLIDGALRVHCSATGKLPGGQSAKSQLTFSGHQGERVQLTKKVLDIVAGGVITRLAELERHRRGLI